MAQDPITFVLGSDLRFKILSRLAGEAQTPTSIASTYDKHVSHVSRALKELRVRRLVSCVTPENRKNRYYTVTARGARVLSELRRLLLSS
jgi:predicted transcriptional regulator